ncbi:isoaspartyl peptidase/L-asparaginase [Aspergillus saccharolyticus JOP 1030-1]|uniref:N-terminal nucleophile aminohydrolase n=1 Tax=Aspergillus saccharolyticus JOP 1030-1 TaxID=1450539 RepID=A0A318ZKM4_9EURO|nr:N-terminal nucleophile aminohydrolase [Aspergillus saccharolyticus JOP 1030-1]PYH45103.1 N-terminal nucleophile aminohydrolase [Aspergillus saccharolyticus JOP 1030-1]
MTTTTSTSDKPPLPALFKPTLILHGGAGAIHRSTLPPDLYAQYHASLLKYLRSTRALLESGASALDAAVHAVSLMEDDPLFNCGRGSVFTAAGTIEMEASLMVCSVNPAHPFEVGIIKRGAGVMGLRNVRHPIQLAREVLVRSGRKDGRRHGGAGGGGGGEDEDDRGSMHSQLVGPYVEDVLARQWGLEFKPDEWFFTQRRWEEHLRGLRGEAETVTMSQGTVGCVCLDQGGGLAVATSTGGLTNKLPGRIGDTPTLGAGFWAEAWEEKGEEEVVRSGGEEMWYGRAEVGIEDRVKKGIWDMTLGDCLPGMVREGVDWMYGSLRSTEDEASWNHEAWSEKERLMAQKKRSRRAVAVSGTGNGDSFLRTAAARTACAISRFSTPNLSLAEAVAAVAGPRGELQRSAGDRWGLTGEGQGGIIGIEAELDESVTNGGELKQGKVVFDFNCGGLWRAWMEDIGDGKEVERVMVFKDEYK